MLTELDTKYVRKLTFLGLRIKTASTSMAARLTLTSPSTTTQFPPASFTTSRQ